MSEQVSGVSDGPVPVAGTGHPVWVSYGLSVVGVAVATGLALLVRELAGAQNVTLVYVLAVVFAATRFGFGPALAATAGSVLAFDFFFTTPYYSLRIDTAENIAATGLLLVIAAIVSAVAANGRRQALAYRRSADRANALHGLAHLVANGAPPEERDRQAVTALQAIFGTSAVILAGDGDNVRLCAASQGSEVSDDERQAAQWCLTQNKPLRGENYPFETAAYDFWPILGAGGASLVLGVSCREGRDHWPDNPERYIELVGAYLGTSRGSGSGSR